MKAGTPTNDQITGRNKCRTILEELETEGIQAQTGAFANLLRMRDRSVGMHSERICSLAREVAKRFELSSRETQLIETASHLHDLGTIAIPDPILHKRGPLTVAERQIMQGHAQFGYDALQQTENFRQVADIVLHHYRVVRRIGISKRLRR